MKFHEGGRETIMKDPELKCNKFRYEDERDNEENITNNKKTMQSLQKNSQNNNKTFDNRNFVTTCQGRLV